MKKKMMVRQVSKKLNKLQVFRESSKGIPSWVEYIRSALGMSLRQLGERTGLDKSNIHRIEKSEAEGQVTLSSLKKMAEAMDCELIYAFVPRESLESTLRLQAEKKAKRVLKESHLHMEYEDQSVSGENLKEQLEDLVEEYMYSKQLWDR